MRYAAAGVARATVYRYFPNRQALLDELAHLAVEDAHARLESARIDEVGATEGVARAVRAFIEVGDSFVVHSRGPARPGREEFERKLAGPLRRLVENGQSSGEITRRRTELLADRVARRPRGQRACSEPRAGREDTIAGITSLFLDGAGAGGPRSA